MVARFVLLFACGAALLSFAIVAGIRFDERSRIGENVAEEHGHIETAEQILWQELEQSAIDVRVLAGAPAVREFVEQGTDENRARVEALFLDFSRETRHYDKVRLIDAGGRELVRVNLDGGNPRVVARQELQDKSSRYFFRESIVLGPREIYVSHFDLNVEDGRIEVPFKPTLRFAMPLFNAAGTRRGVIVLNHLGDALLQRLRNVKRGDHADGFMLLNQDGYWLSGVARADEWGFMLPERADRSFAHDHPGEWRVISRNERGTLPIAGGLVVFDTFRPTAPDAELTASGGNLSKVDITTADTWKIVSIISRAELVGDSYNGAGAKALLALAYVLFAIASWLIAYFSVSRGRARAALQENEARLRVIAETMAEGLVVTGGDGRISYANPQASRLTGYAVAELMGADLHALLHVHQDGSPAAPAECRVMEVLRTGGAERAIEETFRRHDGGLMPVHTNISVMRRDGAPVGVISTFRDVTEIKALQARLQSQAVHDPLTGLHNRLALDDAFSRELVRARRSQRTIGVIMADLDRFKRVNDEHGHHAGDRVLQALAAILQAHSRASDVCCRFGGEEFVIVMPEASKVQAQARAEEIRAALAATQISIDPGVVRVTASFGVAAFPEDGDGSDELIGAADAAMYAAKAAGRNRVVCAQRERREVLAI